MKQAKQARQTSMFGEITAHDRGPGIVAAPTEFVRKMVFAIPSVPFTETHLVNEDIVPICEPSGRSWHLAKEQNFTRACARCLAEASRLHLGIR